MNQLYKVIANFDLILYALWLNLYCVLDRDDIHSVHATLLIFRSRFYGTLGGRTLDGDDVRTRTAFRGVSCGI